MFHNVTAFFRFVIPFRKKPDFFQKKLITKLDATDYIDARREPETDR